MRNEILDFAVSTLSECRVSSPMKGIKFVSEEEHVLYHSNLQEIEPLLKAGKKPPRFEMAGPRQKICFEPSKLCCGIVTCGGICPGLNDVIRAIVLSLYYHYGVRTIFGFRYGYEGLAPKYAHVPLELSPQVVEDIHHKGGTVLGSSRGPQDVSDMVDTLEQLNVGILFTIGGDGTLRGAQAIAQEIERRHLKIAVIGVPKTIDNDISYLQTSFGFETAVTESRTAIYSANMEATGARNGTLANNEVNFCLVPEIPFSLKAFLGALEKRLERRHHAVIVVAEGTGQHLLPQSEQRDASGNVRFGDIGIFLRDQIRAYFNKKGFQMDVKYIDPSYTIRSMPANAHDSVFCLLLGHNAVHAGMSGRTNMVVGNWGNQFTHVPIPLAVSKRKRINPDGRLWSNVIESTGQPRVML
jgi:6-phosphofructokinase 1